MMLLQGFIISQPARDTHADNAKKKNSKNNYREVIILKKTSHAHIDSSIAKLRDWFPAGDPYDFTRNIT